MAPGLDTEQGGEEEQILIPLSALQHYLYCPRQCALIHVEQLWTENIHTAEGRILHERTENPAQARRGKLRTVHGMPLRSHRLGLTGYADMVELHLDAGTDQPAPFPVEIKKGRPKAHRADEVQLCAQALCLEEMFACTIPEGALFYGKSRRRHKVAFCADLRGLTLTVISETREMIASGTTPAPIFDKRKCGACSLIDTCRPQPLARNRSVARWLAGFIENGADEA